MNSVKLTDFVDTLKLSKKDIEEIALKEENVLKFLNTNPKKVIIIPNRIVNFVT